LNRRILLLNVALLALAGTLFWTLREHWDSAKRHERTVLSQRVPPRSVVEPPPAPPVPPVAPANYLQVAQEMLFSKDRNPTVVIEPPPVKPDPPMPPLPHYHGQMAIGEPVALLSTDKIEQKGYHAGDAIGDFKLVQFDREKIAFEWMGKTVERKVVDLVPKETIASSQPAQSAAAKPVVSPVVAPAATSSPSPSIAITALGGGGGGATSLDGTSAAKPPAGMGDDIGSGVRNCVPGDNSPAGTVREGYKKTVSKSMFGDICRWEPVK